MADQSPIVNRIRDRFLKKIQDIPARLTGLRLPRRGRIRVLLAVVLVIVGSRIAGPLIRSMGAPGGSCAAMADTAKKNGVPGYTTYNKKIGDRLSINDVADLLDSARPKMAGDRDTITGRGGRVVAYYSLDPELQGFIRDILKLYKPRYGAAVVLDPKSGRVFAFASYRNDTVPDRGNRLFLRSVFPAASIFKTVTASAAIEKANYSPQTLVPVTGPMHTLYKFQLKKEIACTDEVLFEEAFAKSMNPVFGRVGMHVLGRETLLDYCSRFGFNTSIPFELHVDTSRASVPGDTTYQMAEFASGFNRHTSLSPLHGALIASAVAEQGVMPFPHFVDSVCRIDNGECVYRSAPASWKTCMTRATSGELRAMMNRVVQKGTARKSFRCLNSCYWSSGIDYGGKTGSLDQDSLGKVDWFIGFAKQRDEQGHDLAIAVVTTHGSMWTVHSSYIASEVFRKFCRPELKTIAASPIGAKESPGPAAAPVKIKG